MRINGIDIGPGHPCYVIAEIGINHNGSLAIAKKLIDVAKEAGAQAVKFQKRTVDVVYSVGELTKKRESPWGTTNGDLKRHLEFGRREYEEIDRHCRDVGISWFASPWDEGSVHFLEALDVCAYKVASASITDIPLLEAIAKTGKPAILSTGMSTVEEVMSALGVLGDPAVLHCTSLYPCPVGQINLRAMRWGHPFGYSGHEMGTAPTLAAVAMGASIVERHITLDRTMYGSDQSASLEPEQFIRLVADIREVEAAMGDGVKVVYPEEEPVKAKLRRVG